MNAPQSTDLVSQLRFLRRTAKFRYAKDEFYMVGEVMHNAADEIERLREALGSLLPGLVLDLRYADDDDDKDAMRSRIQTVEEALGSSADVPANHVCVFSRTGGPIETHCVLCGAPTRTNEHGS